MRPLFALSLLFATPGLAQDQIRITEWMYKGANAEFFELTNVGASPVDLTGWSFDDIDAQPGKTDLSPLGIVAAGESVIVTDFDAQLFELEWGLSGVKVLGGNVLSNLKRNDAVHLFDASLNLHDQLHYGDEDFPGSVRTDGLSAYVCDEALGANFVWSWRASELGDVQGSWTSLGGDVGNPGSHVGSPCSVYRYCSPAVANSTGFGGVLIATGSFVAADNLLNLTASQMPPNQFGYFLTSQTQGFVAQPPGSQGNLCLSGNIGRFNGQVQNSGPGGEFTIPVDLTAMPVSPPHAVVAGETWNFSTWYRDVNPGPTSNFSDAVSITFE
jgi:Lamin Tail Domain